ncbi:hypothetical protein HELRODRAFT_183356 [Helobdella robusta]|uniref:tRNA/rRNA methyltransferase SpoU type domain-containing protein n=1 Tax=Helobdella robusta TaxID=6412 RepID=T1FJI2_HELRO|nr:hypothetical protein HELRODRAFT_183356 [Helobdella robusta]ESO11252.1 hypothetical protein HELRODRAFT_183356 [Helobdella robusta]
MNHSKEKFLSSERLPVKVICDTVRYHGNVGTMLKTFFYLNCQEFILTKGSVDIWNPKTLEASDGCQLFHHNYITTEQSWHDINHLIPRDALVFYAESEKLSQHKNFLEYKNLDCVLSCRKNIVLIIGGETEGVSNEAKDFCSSRNGHAVFIPMRKEVESLNGGVAASILLFEMARILKKNIEI